MAALTYIVVTFTRKLLFLCYFTLNKTNMYAAWKLLCSFKLCNKMTSCICIARHHLVFLHWLANSAQATHIWVFDSLIGSRRLMQDTALNCYKERSIRPDITDLTIANKHQKYQLPTLKLNYIMCACIEKREMNKIERERDSWPLGKLSHLIPHQHPMMVTACPFLLHRICTHTHTHTHAVGFNLSILLLRLHLEGVELKR